MKIGIDVRELKRNKVTGTGRYLLNFLKFATKKKPEWEFVLFGNQTTKIELEAPNLKKIFISEYLTFWWDQIQLPHYLKKKEIDIFLTPYFKTPLFAACKLVLVINDLIFLLSPARQNSWDILLKIYFKNLVNMITKRADRVITISYSSKSDIIKMFRIPEQKIRVVTLAVDGIFHHIDFDPEEITSKYKIKKKFIFYFGKFSPYKNVKTLIEAYYRLLQKTKDEYQLVLGGRRDKQCLRLERMIEHLKLNDRVIFTDFISDEHLPAIYNAASLFVFPSLYEGFGLPPLESMACGTPVIASNAGSLPEVLGDAALLVNPEDTDGFTRAMEKVLTNDSLQKSMIVKGLERTKLFKPDNMTEGFMQVLEECGKDLLF